MEVEELNMLKEAQNYEDYIVVNLKGSSSDNGSLDAEDHLKKTH
jgi:hypothetical protein